MRHLDEKEAGRAQAGPERREHIAWVPEMLQHVRQQDHVELTVAALRYGLKTKDCEREYMKLREKYDLPEAMALRKTVAQWVQELAGEEESKVLYRAEGYGTHYSSYVCNLTPGQVAKLDRALDAVRAKILA